jgi:hypothetical protein
MSDSQKLWTYCAFLWGLCIFAILLDEEPVPEEGVQPDKYDWVLNYTLTSRGEDRGTWSSNVAIYDTQVDCLNLSRGLNRERPGYLWRGFELSLAYAGCNRITQMTDEQRRNANIALRQALQGLRKI